MPPPKDRAYLIYRVLIRLNEQAMQALKERRDEDAASIGRLIGRLEAQHFHVFSFEISLEDVSSKRPVI